MRSIHRIIHVLVSILISFLVHGQHINTNTFKDDVEHIKLITDRDLYISGEDVYFTADYFINQEKSYPILSNKLYIELVESSSGIPLVQKKYKINNFKVSGKVCIPRNVISGCYYLRAYTPIQRNLSGFNYSSYHITVLNPENQLAQEFFSSDNDSILVAVEGGVLLDSLKSNIVFKLPKSIINSNNKCIIVDEQENLIKELDHQTSGFIQAELVLFKSKNYKLKVTQDGRDSIIKKLPKVLDRGIQTKTSFGEEDFNYHIHTKGIDWDTENNHFKLKIFNHNYNITYSENISLMNNAYSKVISSSYLNGGINYIVLFDREGNIIKINSVFKFDTEKSIDIKLDKDSYEPREKIEGIISCQSKEQRKLPFVSVSVIRTGAKKEDHDFIPEIYLHNPVSLEGYINSNMQDHDELQKQIMILYDKSVESSFFITEKYLKNRDIEFIPKLRDNNISGVLINKETKEPVANYTIYLVVLFKNPQIHVTKTTEKGEFIFSVDDMYGMNDIFLCYESYDEKEDNAHEILVKSPFSKDYLPDTAKIFIDNDDQELIEEMYMNAQIEQKFSKKQKDYFIEQNELSSFNIRGKSLTIYPDDYIDLKNMQELFTEIVPGVVVKQNKRKKRFGLKIVSEDGSILDENPLVLIDHIPIFNMNSIMDLDPSQIQKIEVIHRAYILDAFPYGGVIMLTTKIDNFAMVELPKSSVFTKYMAIEDPNDRFIVKQNSLDTLRSIPNFKNTLFWHPQILLNNEGQTINVRASDRKGRYKIVVKGYDEEGILYYGEKMIAIK